jgi:hypothetical protein
MVRKEDVLRKQAENPVQTPKVARQTRKEQAIAEQKRAEVQADIDAHKLPPAPEEIAESYKLVPGEVPPLAVLNARAKLTAAATRDAAREIANAAGKAAFETAQGRISRGPHKRYEKLRDAEARLAAASAAAEKQG